MMMSIKFIMLMSETRITSGVDVRLSEVFQGKSSNTATITIDHELTGI